MKESITLLKTKEEMARAETEAVRLVLTFVSWSNLLFLNCLIALYFQVRLKDVYKSTWNGKMPRHSSITVLCLKFIPFSCRNNMEAENQRLRKQFDRVSVYRINSRLHAQKLIQLLAILNFVQERMRCTN